MPLTITVATLPGTIMKTGAVTLRATGVTSSMTEAVAVSATTSVGASTVTAQTSVIHCLSGCPDELPIVKLEDPLRAQSLRPVREPPTPARRRRVGRTTGDRRPSNCARPERPPRPRRTVEIEVRKGCWPGARASNALWALAAVTTSKASRAQQPARARELPPQDLRARRHDLLSPSTSSSSCPAAGRYDGSRHGAKARQEYVD